MMLPQGFFFVFCKSRYFWRRLQTKLDYAQTQLHKWRRRKINWLLFSSSLPSNEGKKFFLRM